MTDSKQDININNDINNTMTTTNAEHGHVQETHDIEKQERKNNGLNVLLSRLATEDRATMAVPSRS